MDVEVMEAKPGAVTVKAPALDPVTLPIEATGFAHNSAAKLGIRPQYLNVPEDDRSGSLHGRVALVERLGTETVVNVELARGGRVVAALAEDRPLELGSEIALGFEPSSAHLFADV